MILFFYPSLGVPQCTAEAKPSSSWSVQGGRRTDRLIDCVPIRWPMRDYFFRFQWVSIDRVIIIITSFSWSGVPALGPEGRRGVEEAHTPPLPGLHLEVASENNQRQNPSDSIKIEALINLALIAAALVDGTRNCRGQQLGGQPSSQGSPNAAEETRRPV